VRPLTPRQIEVLQGFADGLGNAAVAERLGMASTTVKTHRAAALRRLGVAHSTAAVARGFREGWLR
jgi:DNA-binding NarL/FixJ family response regulator